MKEIIKKIQRELAELDEINKKQKDIANSLGEAFRELKTLVALKYKDTTPLILLLHFIKSLEKENNALWKYVYQEGTDTIYNLEDNLQLLEATLNITEKDDE